MHNFHKNEIKVCCYSLAFFFESFHCYAYKNNSSLCFFDKTNESAPFHFTYIYQDDKREMKFSTNFTPLLFVKAIDTVMIDTLWIWRRILKRRYYVLRVAPQGQRWIYVRSLRIIFFFFSLSCEWATIQGSLHDDLYFY